MVGAYPRPHRGATPIFYRSFEQQTRRVRLYQASGCLPVLNVMVLRPASFER